ncbi:Iron-sulfur cluster-binding protein [hydrothermal vent metagenome]|uniref:Iron-sulfur cluster-binding protein n=1 Tax=hydrothermal vent metagenome TaxID=652676 RepID=A0A3B0T4H4_9ZZZZ
MPSGRRGRFALGTPVLDAARALGVYIESVCGGRGMCTRCQVDLTEGEFAKHGLTSKNGHLSGVTDAEAAFLARGRLAAGRRMSCQARILGDAVIDVPQEARTQRAVVRKRAETRTIALDPAIQAYTVSVARPDMDSPSGDLDRLLASITAKSGLAEVEADFTVLPGLQAVLRQGEWTVSVAVSVSGPRPRLIGLWPGAHDKLIGLAVDIGSTTIAAHLIDLATGRTIATAGTANPQIRFGEDLMSRVSYVMMNQGGEAALTTVVREAVGALAAKATADVGLRRHDILDAVIVGNPVMLHLFLGLSPVELGQAPFALAVSGALNIPARELGLGFHPGAAVYIPPCIAGHVGADAAAAILAEGPHRGEDVTLLVDIGTNAEIILGNSARLLAASSPTGPAFEGAEIAHGQRAAPGAIERVRIDPKTLEPRLSVIGIEAWSDRAEFAAKIDTVGVTGICGSGIVEVVAELFLAGVVTGDGVIDGAAASRSPRIVADGRTFSYVLWRGENDIVVTQKDIRAIQLAKAALYAGARLLMDRLGVASVDRIRLAGAFGSYIDPKYAMVLGLIPDCDLAQVKSVGNAAGTGARMALLNRGHRAEIEALAGRIEKVETATEPRFSEHFINAMALPNKVEAFPRLAKAVALPERAPASSEQTPKRRRRR